MTNAMIILIESIKLMEEGIIGSTDNKLKVEINGELKEFNEPEEIHTYATWQAKGYQVKSGEKAKAKFNVWKMCKPSKKAIEEAEKKGETAKGKMIMKMSAFFSASQVELKEA